MKRYEMMAGLPIEIEVVMGGRYMATISGYVDSIRGSGGLMATALRVVATDMATAKEVATGVATATEPDVATATEHVPGDPYRLRYLGSGDGAWVADCSCGDYRSALYLTAEMAAKVAWAHAKSKNGDSGA